MLDAGAAGLDLFARPRLRVLRRRARAIIPDNLRSGVSRAGRYEPDLNPTYDEMAAHYNVAVMPARPYKPRDKAKVEAGVQVVERWILARWILARLRQQTFFSLAELNKVIRALTGGSTTAPSRSSRARAARSSSY
jgi:transposase